MRYRETAALEVEQEISERELLWTSSDPEVVTVDRQGNLTAKGIGLATVTCSTVDGIAIESCEVTVRFAFWQVLIELFLFGWLWY